MRKLSGFAEDSCEAARAARPGDRPGDRPGADPRPAGAGLWDIDDVGAYLRIPVNAVYKMTARRASVRIPYIRIGGRLRFRQHDIDQWLSLLTTSNTEALSRMRQKVTRATHGHHSQT